ncbi:MAG TPA: aspartate aminotransferase family protein [Actinomycetota bacterium]|nr:aspartate aminotransferase family protein [Actinomycetota bacterium]
MDTHTDTVEIDLGLVEELTKHEVEALDRKHARSLSYREEAKAHLPGGVSSSWQMWPPHPIYVDRGRGSKVWDIDGNEYVDYHNGYGVMVMGHAHPKIVEAVQRRVELGTHFAQPTEDALIVAEGLAERYRLPYWRFGNSGTESTLDAVRIMRAATGRNLIMKIEGSYHGHHDSLMVSVFPPKDLAGPREHPVPVPQTQGMPEGVAEQVVVVPFNDAAAAERAFREHEGRIAGMVVEPVMSNCGVVLPDAGYLAALKELCHRNGAMLAFDEVKTGFTVARGGAVEAFGVVPDLVCLAKALGAGLPCGAIGGTEESMAMILSGELEQVGTFNGNPLTMAAARANLTEVLTPDAYREFDRINGILSGCQDVIDRYRLPASIKLLGAKGSIDWRKEPIREYRDLWEIDDRIPQLAWLWQLNRGVFKSPGSKWESWTASIVHSDEDVQRYVDNFEEMAEAITTSG